jgi:hypothetical protein
VGSPLAIEFGGFSAAGYISNSRPKSLRHERNEHRETPSASAGIESVRHVLRQMGASAQRRTTERPPMRLIPFHFVLHKGDGAHRVRKLALAEFHLRTVASTEDCQAHGLARPPPRHAEFQYGSRKEVV